MLYTYMLGLLFFHLGPAALVSSPSEEEQEEEVCWKESCRREGALWLAFPQSALNSFELFVVVRVRDDARRRGRVLETRNHFIIREQNNIFIHN